MKKKTKNNIHMTKGVRRIYVEKKADFAVKAKEMKEEMAN